MAQLDYVQRRVQSILLAGAARAHGYPPVSQPVPVCECTHSDDQHYGVDGELHCSMCVCRSFLFAREEAA